MARKRWVYRPTKESKAITALHAKGLWPVMGTATTRGRERLETALANHSVTTPGQQLLTKAVSERLGVNGDSNLYYLCSHTSSAD
jgi:hypothetical protein